MKISVYKHPFRISDGSTVFFQFIVIVDEFGHKHFTDFGKYIRPANNMLKEDSNGNNAYSFVRMLLEYIFVYTDTRSLSELTIDTVKDFFRLYHTCELPWDDEDTSRSSATQRRCRDVIMNFLTRLIEAGIVPFKTSDMYRTTSKRISRGAGRGKITKVKVPVFEIVTKRSKSTKRIYRDIPDKAFQILFTLIRQHHHDLFGLVCCSAFVGFRPSEACNVRRHDCAKYGPGVRFTLSRSNKPSSIVIDLSRELKMRSDGKHVGGIKKEREQDVTKLFRDAFYTAYNEQIEYCEGRPREEEYGALNVNRQGKCMTYANYYKRFRSIVNDEFVPILISSEDQELVEYGRILMDYNLSPHVFRHWFTVQLVLSGAYNDVEIANARGDKSLDSARAYLENKSELEKRYRKVTDGMWDILLGEATKLFTK